MSRILLAGLLALALPVLAACDSTDDDDDETRDTIADLVVADADLSTLRAAVAEADLDDDLAGDGPFTVFAPANSGFQNLLTQLGATPEELLDRDDLEDILELHVVPARVLSSGLQAGQTVTTLNGETLTVVTVNAGFGLDTEDAGSEANAVIVDADIEASNGVIHKIDSVLLPAN